MEPIVEEDEKDDEPDDELPEREFSWFKSPALLIDAPPMTPLFGFCS